MTNIDFSELSVGQRKATTIAMRDLIVLVNGVDESAVNIQLSQGSLTVEATMQMPAGEGSRRSQA